MSGPAPWWVGVPATQASIACGPNEHRLAWAEGRLAALDHLDAAAEEVLAALGADEPTCLAVVRHWADHAGDPRVLAAASRHPGDTPGLTDGAMGPVRAEAARRRRPGPGQGPPPRAEVDAVAAQLGLLELLALDPALVRRLQQEVAHHLADGREPSPVLEAATVGRLTPILRRWTGGVGRIDVRLGDRPGVDRRNGSTVATVRPSWLAEVWGRYLGVVDGFVVVDVHRIVEDRAEVTGVGAPGGDPARLVLRGPAPWHVERRAEAG